MNLKSRLKEVFTSGDTYTVLTLLKALIDEMDGIEFATPENIAELHEDFDELVAEFNALENNTLKVFVTNNDIDSLSNDELNTINEGNYGFVICKLGSDKFIYVVTADGTDWLEFARISSEEHSIYSAYYELISNNNWELRDYSETHVTSLYMHRITFNHTEVEKGELIASGVYSDIYIVSSYKTLYNSSDSFTAMVGVNDVISISCRPATAGYNPLIASRVLFNNTDNELEITTGIDGAYVLYSGVTTITDHVTII